jgi:hypothetical protein
MALATVHPMARGTRDLNYKTFFLIPCDIILQASTFLMEEHSIFVVFVLINKKKFALVKYAIFYHWKAFTA